MTRLFTFLCSLLVALASIRASEAASAPYPPVPTAGQLEWHDLEMYAFLHFTTNTFTDKEWGYGDEDPALFAPTDYDPDQMVGTLARTGFKGIVLTCKHHDGFCLWPTKTTKHSVESTPWKEGKGDVVKDISEACRKYNIRFGIYVSPWDRNHPDYGTPAYVKVYREQIRELMTRYGPVFIVWHDGANGGDGYYGGKREKRSIDRVRYYDWPNTWKMIRKLQSDTVIFSDVGPDVRWIGNEKGKAGYPCWATYTPRTEDGSPPGPGVVISKDGEQGTLRGKYWIPAEVDVSIRPGWFWHERENNLVRSPENLLELYFDSVGRGANLNLNVPPDRRGKLHEKDVASLEGFHKLLQKLYSRNYAEGAKITASSAKKGTTPQSILGIDRKRTSYWMAEGENTSTLTIKLPEARTFSVVRLAEPIQLGQRIRRFSIQVKDDSGYSPWLDGSSIGARVLLRGDTVTTDELRLVIEESDTAPALCEFSLWEMPVILKTPEVTVDRHGTVVVTTPFHAETRYTIDGTEPGRESPLYNGQLSFPKGGLLKIRNFTSDDESPTWSMLLPVSTTKWKIISGEDKASPPENAIDGDPSTLWHTHSVEHGELSIPQELVIDMGEEIAVDSILCTPRQDGSAKGVITHCAVFISSSPDQWGAAAAYGEFSNIRANPITQTIDFKKPVTGRYLKFVALKVLEGSHASMAELRVTTREAQ